MIGSEQRRGQLIHAVFRLTVTVETKAYSNAARDQKHRRMESRENKGGVFNSVNDSALVNKKHWPQE